MMSSLVNCRKFDNSLNISSLIKEGYKEYDRNPVFSVVGWLKENIGSDNFDFGFEDRGQAGNWMLYTRSIEDVVAFKLRFGI